jgi:hypothetical protein
MCSPAVKTNGIVFPDDNKERIVFVAITFTFFLKKALTVLHGPLASPNGLLDHI